MCKQPHKFQSRASQKSLCEFIQKIKTELGDDAVQESTLANINLVRLGFAVEILSYISHIFGAIDNEVSPTSKEREKTKAKKEAALRHDII